MLIVDRAAVRAGPDRAPTVEALDDALRELAKHDERKAHIVELRFFGGLTLQEIAEVMGVAPITVSREWAKARAWLHRQVTRESPALQERR
jgi:RNA polymerase sigma factor (sigma-70 family)